MGFTSYNDDFHFDRAEGGFKEAEVQFPKDIELRPLGQRKGKLDLDICAFEVDVCANGFVKFLPCRIIPRSRVVYFVLTPATVVDTTSYRQSLPLYFGLH